MSVPSKVCAHRKQSKEQSNKLALDAETLKKFRTRFNGDPKNTLAQNACSRVDPFDVSLSRKRLESIQHVFSHKVEAEGKPVSNQKQSGRCWIFSALNVMRIPFCKALTIDEFEFSQSYLFFWDKIERSNYFLSNIVEATNRGEEVTGRLISFLLNDPTCDGGQWDMFVNLINKYGLVPKKCFPESFSSEASLRLNTLLKSKLREYAHDLRTLISSGASDADITIKIGEQMAQVYNIVAICLGIPSETITWEYYDKSKQFHSIGPVTPLEFYTKHVKPVFDVDEKVCLVTDPRPTSPFGQAFTVDCLGNMVGGRPVLYNNQPVELLMSLAAKSIKNGDAVWFGSEVGKRFAGKQGILDIEIHDFKTVFNCDIQVTLTKADRLIYGESCMTHAMALTAVSLNIVTHSETWTSTENETCGMYNFNGKMMRPELFILRRRPGFRMSRYLQFPNQTIITACLKENDEPTKFRVENSWGEDRGEKGYLIMTPAWFEEFVFELVVDRSLVPEDVLDVFKQTPTVLPAWDPMGTLAKEFNK